MPNSYRIRTEIGVDKVLQVKLDQDYDTLEVLSMAIFPNDVYTRSCADFGVVCGRVFCNKGLGLQNARVSIFIPIEAIDENNPIVSVLYPYKNFEDVNEDGYKYNLLPYTKSFSNHVPVGTFPDRIDALTNESVIEVYDKYYKFTAKTNLSGDFMIFGIPVGQYDLFMQLDLSDIGEFSLTPQDLIRIGRATEAQVDGVKFAFSENYSELPQIVTITKTIQVAPFYGQEGVCQHYITRADFDITTESLVKLEPTSVFMGSLISHNDRKKIKRSCKVPAKAGWLCDLITGPGQIEAIRQTILTDEDGRPILEEFILENSGKVIDENGTWVLEVPMNLDYVYTDEAGNRRISEDGSQGVPTRGKYRFKIKWNQSPRLNETTKRGYFLVPNIKEHGWENSDSENIVPPPSPTSFNQYPSPSGPIPDITFTHDPGGIPPDDEGFYEINFPNQAVLGTPPNQLYYSFISSQNVEELQILVQNSDGDWVNSPEYSNYVPIAELGLFDVRIRYKTNDNTGQTPAVFNYRVMTEAIFLQECSYAFSLNWVEYGNDEMIQDAIDCKDRFYEMLYNKVYTVSQLLDRFSSQTFPQKAIEIKHITQDKCEGDYNPFPANDVYYRYDVLFLIFSFILRAVVQPILIIVIIILHVLAWIYDIFLKLYDWWIKINNFISKFCNKWNDLVYSKDIIPDRLAFSNCPAEINGDSVPANPFKNIKLGTILYTDDGCERCKCNIEDIPAYENNIANQIDEYNNEFQNTSYLADFTSTSSFDNSQSPAEISEIISQVMAGSANDFGGLAESECFLTVPISRLTGFENTWLLSTSLPLGERVNLFNTKMKYYDNTNDNGSPGNTGWNQIKVSYWYDNPSNQTTFLDEANGQLLTLSKFHYDNVLVLIMDSDDVEVGDLLTFQDPSKSQDPNAGTSIGYWKATNVPGQNTITVKYADPSDFSNGTASQTVYNVPPSAQTEHTSCYPADIEYFQAIHKINLEDFFNNPDLAPLDFDGDNRFSLPYRFLDSSWGRDISARPGGIFNPTAVKSDNTLMFPDDPPPLPNSNIQPTCEQCPPYNEVNQMPNNCEWCSGNVDYWCSSDSGGNSPLPPSANAVNNSQLFSSVNLPTKTSDSNPWGRKFYNDFRIYQLGNASEPGIPLAAGISVAPWNKMFKYKLTQLGRETPIGSTSFDYASQGFSVYGGPYEGSTTPNQYYNPGLIYSNAGIFNTAKVTTDIWGKFGREGKVMVIIQRGVDPHSPKIPIEFDLSRLYGRNTYGQVDSLKVRGEFRMNIPIQPKTKLTKMLDVTNNDPVSAVGYQPVFFNSYFYRIDNDNYNGNWTTNLPLYYSALDEFSIYTSGTWGNCSDPTYFYGEKQGVGLCVQDGSFIDALAPAGGYDRPDSWYSTFFNYFSGAFWLPEYKLGGAGVSPSEIEGTGEAVEISPSEDYPLASDGGNVQPCLSGGIYRDMWRPALYFKYNKDTSNVGGYWGAEYIEGASCMGISLAQAECAQYINATATWEPNCPYNEVFTGEGSETIYWHYNATYWGGAGYAGISDPGCFRCPPVPSTTLPYGQIGYFSPTYTTSQPSNAAAFYWVNTAHTISMSYNNGLVFRTDRLPTSTSVKAYIREGQTGGNGLIMHQNNTFAIFNYQSDNCSAEQQGGYPEPEQTQIAEIDLNELPNQENALFVEVAESLTDCTKAVNLNSYGVQGDGTPYIKDENPFSVVSFSPNNKVFFVRGMGCYNFVSVPFKTLFGTPNPTTGGGGDIASAVEWVNRTVLNLALCFDIFSHTFSNNWINGTLYAYPFQQKTVFDDENQPIRGYCKHVVYLHKPTNSFYYRSSPWDGNEFIGKDNIKLGQLTQDRGNIRNLMYPTTIIDLGPKVSYLQEIVLSDDYDGYIISKIPSTTFKNITDIVNLFVLSRLVNVNFLSMLLPLNDSGNSEGADDPSVTGFFKNTRWANGQSFFNGLLPSLVDGDYAQMISINSEFGIQEYNPETYGPDDVYFLNDDLGNSLFGLTLSGDNQDRDYISPRRTILNANASISSLEGNFINITTDSQTIPMYQWTIVFQNGGAAGAINYQSIFGNQNNDFYSNFSDAFKNKYQDLDRFATSSEYFRPGTSVSTNTFYYKGYIVNFIVDPATNTIQITAQAPEQANRLPHYTFGGPFHFYFGLIQGASAMDRFITKYVDTNLIYE
jgi:hypothetical protein